MASPAVSRPTSLHSRTDSGEHIPPADKTLVDPSPAVSVKRGSSPSSQRHPWTGAMTPSPEACAQVQLKRRPWLLKTTPAAAILSHPYQGSGTQDDPFLINFLPNDVENPQNFAMSAKWGLVGFVSMATLAVALASSAYSGAVKSIQADFGGTEVQLTAGVSCFVLGFALGPLAWAPLSELWGRRNLFLFSYVMLTLWNGVAIASPNLGALIVFRFLAGAFGSSPLTNAGGTVADCFDAKTRGLGMALFAAAPFLGPALGPITGGFLGITGGWKWVMGFLTIFSAVICLFAAFFLTETYAPLLLRQRAERLSRATGKLHVARIDKGKDLRVSTLFKIALSRPWQLLVREPIVIMLSLYIAIVYATLYSFFTAFPIVFEQMRGWNAGVSGLAFLGVLVGMMMALVFVVVHENPRYIRISEAHGGSAPPEARLYSAKIGSPLLVIGLAWFAATDSPSVHWIVPIMAGAPFGGGMVLVFLSTMGYLVDSYVIYAASVLAANSVIRSLFGMAFPLFTSQMYASVGIHWGPAISCFLAAICLPFPFVFAHWGPSIRARCKYSAEAKRILEVMQNGEKGSNDTKDAPDSASDEGHHEYGLVDEEKAIGTTPSGTNANIAKPQPASLKAA